MSNLFLLGIYLLIFGNMCVATTVVVLLILFLKRQKQGFQYMTAQLMQMEKMLKLSSATRSISVDAVELGDNK